MSCGSRGGERWFCLWTHPRQEFRAYAELSAQKFRAYLPLHLHRPIGHPERNAIIPLFPRYLFVAFDPSASAWRYVYSTHGIAGVIQSAPERPTPIPAGVIERLIDRTSARGVVDDPGQDAGAVYLCPGERARVLTGTLAGFEGVCTRSAHARVTLLLSLFARAVPIEFAPGDLEKID